MKVVLVVNVLVFLKYFVFVLMLLYVTLCTMESIHGLCKLQFHGHHSYFRKDSQIRKGKYSIQIMH